MMKTFEVMIAGAIIISMLAMLSIPMLSPQAKYAELKSHCEAVLLSLAEDNNFRAVITRAYDENDLNTVKQYLDLYIQYPFEIQLCDENYNCIGSRPDTNNYVLVSYLFDGNVTEYKVTLVKLYAWLYATE